MAWRFRKSKAIGPFRTNVSIKGIGTSFGILGLRLGITADRRTYFSFGIPGTSLYYIKYF